MEKRKVKEIIGTPIKEYKLPLLERTAYYRPVLIWFFWLSMTAMIVLPTIYVNYEKFWYYILILPLIILFVVAIINLIRFCWFVNRKNAKIKFALKNRSSFYLYSGAPGTGKSVDSIFITHEMAKDNWNELQFEYWLIAPKLRDKNYKPTLDEEEVIDAYEFYSKNNGVPCWGSNIPAYSKRYKRFSYDISSSLLKQEVRAPYKLVGSYDELGTQLPMEMKDDRKSNKDGATNVTDFCKFGRHFGKLTFIGTEQEPSNIYKDFRRVVGEIRVFNGMQELLKPIFLTWVYSKLKNHFVSKMRYSESVLFSMFMKFFNKYISLCGFLKFNYKIKSNTETGSVQYAVDTGEKDCVYMPCASEFVYRSRAFREAYLAKDKPIDLKPWESLFMTDERARKMLKSENLSKNKES